MADDSRAKNRRAKNGPYPYYEHPRIKNLREMVEQKQRECPERTAFSYPDGTGRVTAKSFGDVYRDMNALGGWMFAQKIRNRHVALLGENSYLWIVSFLAIVNGGNVAVPIDKALPGKEIVRLLKKADVTVVFCSDAYRGRTEGVQGARVFTFEELARVCDAAVAGDAAAESGDAAVESADAIAESGIVAGDKSGAADCETAGRERYADYAIDADACCCIFFTSGTSGQSKGVCLSQRNLASELNQACALVELGGNTIALLPFHHAFGLVEGVFAVFHYGYENYLNKSLKTVRRVLAGQKPQHLFLVPLFVETFHRQIWDEAKKQGRDRLLCRLMRFSDRLLAAGIDLRAKLFASVREAFGGKLEYIISGGAAIDSFYIKEFRSWGIEILNGYGATECSPCISVNRNHHHKDGTTGLLLPGVAVKTAPDGEVLVSGDIVMQGYYKEPEATAVALADGWYATGDIGYLDANGFLTLTGRKKNLIVRSDGENVSPEELESALALDEAVREVLVYERDGGITAEIYPNEAHTGDTAYFDALRRSVNAGWPAYKRIDRVRLRTEEFVKNSGMKIVRYQNQSETGKNARGMRQ